jgi:hypothetical protein
MQSMDRIAHLAQGEGGQALAEIRGSDAFSEDLRPTADGRLQSVELAGVLRFREIEFVDSVEVDSQDATERADLQELLQARRGEPAHLGLPGLRKVLRDEVVDMVGKIMDLVAAAPAQDPASTPDHAAQLGKGPVGHFARERIKMFELPASTHDRSPKVCFDPRIQLESMVMEVPRKIQCRRGVCLFTRCEYFFRRVYVCSQA